MIALPISKHHPGEEVRQMAGPGTMQKGKKFPAEILTEEEIDLIFRTLSKRAPTQVRNRALFYVGLKGGLRISEALHLMPRDVDTKANTIHVRFGKGGKSRLVGIADDGCLAIDAWMKKRAQLGLNADMHLFCSLDGKPLFTSYVRASMARLRRRTGILKRLHFHQLRHTCAYRMMARGKSLGIIQKMLGHSSLATTSLYLDHVAPLDVVNAMKDI
jgi:site-specific recombinase XerD